VPSGRLSRPGWRLVGGVALALALWFGLPRLLSGFDFFQVRRIELVGVRYSNPGDVVAALGLPRRLSIFDNLDGVRRRAAKVPGTTSVAVSRRPPGTLRVEVVERPVIALVPADGRLAIMDTSGRLMPFDPALGAPDLPLAEAASPPVAGLLGRVRDADPALFARIASARGGPNAVVLDLGGQQLLFRPDASSEVIRTVMAVAQDCAQKGRRWQELDGRFAGMVIVRRGNG
jgi:cell division septal protein FtsQ